MSDTSMESLRTEEINLNSASEQRDDSRTYGKDIFLLLLFFIYVIKWASNRRMDDQFLVYLEHNNGNIFVHVLIFNNRWPDKVPNNWTIFQCRPNYGKLKHMNTIKNFSIM